VGSSSPALSDLTCPFHHSGASVASVAAAHRNQLYLSRKRWPVNTNLDKARRLWPIKQR
jgi:catalase (peroxidase I)